MCSRKRRDVVVAATDMTTNDRGSDGAVSLTSSLTRRRLASLAGVAVAGGGGVAYVSGDASADVTVDELEVGDARIEAREADPVVTADIAYAYQYAGAQELRFEVLIGDDVIASETLRTSSDTLDETTTLSGRVADADAWALEDFAVARGGELTREVTVTVRFAVLVNGSVAAEDSASVTADVAVVWPEGASYATVGGVVSFSDAG